MTPHFSRARALALGSELRDLRRQANLRQADVAARLGGNRAPSHVSRWERGELLISVEDTASVLTICEVTDEEERVRLLRLAREAADPNWIVPGAGRGLAALADVESSAERIVNVEPLIIPGLLQTEAYARSIMAGAGTPEDQADQRVKIRLSRQALLERDDGPEFVAIIGESALRYYPCGVAVMLGQLRKLLDLAQRPNVSILVLPSNVGPYSPALEGSFVLMDVRHGDSQVYREGYRATMTLTNSRDVRDYQNAVDQIRRRAMNADLSAAFIAQLLEEMEGGVNG